MKSKKSLPKTASGVMLEIYIILNAGLRVSLLAKCRSLEPAVFLVAPAKKANSGKSGCKQKTVIWWLQHVFVFIALCFSTKINTFHMIFSEITQNSLDIKIFSQIVFFSYFSLFIVVQLVKC